MLKHLTLKNLVLIDRCEMEFDAGLNILSGETGSGKTAIIEGIHLVLGNRADLSLIRNGENMACAEALFEMSPTPALLELFEEAGIHFDPAEPLIVRREIHKMGKNRAFINSQPVSLLFLQKAGKCLIEVVDQHSHQELRSQDGQRAILDLFAQLENELLLFKTAWTKEQELSQQLEMLLKNSSSSSNAAEKYRVQLLEIQETNLKKNEEEQLIEEHNRLAHAQEISQKLQSLYLSIGESPNSILSQIGRHKNILQSLISIDSSLKDVAQMLHEASINLNECFSQLSSYLNRLESNPKRFEFLDKRLAVIQQFKRKYGASLEEIAAFQKNLEDKLFLLENLDAEIENKRKELQISAQQTQLLANQLTQKRRDAAAQLNKALTLSIQHLNMKGAEIDIEIKPKPRCFNGDDNVTLWIAPNIGEAKVSVKDHSSGGELSRLMLAIKTTLAEKNQTPIIIFDEIDANVGGETASMIGQMLRSLGAHRQILCITHFPQVAREAHRHLAVIKKESDQRTITQVRTLHGIEKEKELLRMLGGKKGQLFSENLNSP